ncbi:UNVERIFIED_CONTAM: hypothetical protein PYX00_010034 [Menopon gallinae]|uniref:Hyaluronan/mRNA-binding protein domain-containing protein n=1 Tax=Menopon gallinae TaxID=328185 RepID=A0AAW2HDW1_9NEOP
MEQEYVIGVANRYALFLEESSHEEDPFDLIKNVEAEKSKKKTLKTVSGESKENKGKPDPKAKTAVSSARKSQGIKETQNVKPVDPGAVTKTKPQDGALKNSKPAGGRKGGDKPQGERTTAAPDKTVKFATGEPQNERTNNRRPREEKVGERNGDIGRNRNFRDDAGPKGNDSDNGPRPPRNEDSQRPPRRDGDRPFRGGDRDRERNERQQGDAENRPPRREGRERRDFQDRADFPREGGENGEGRPDRRPGALAGRSKGGRQGGGPGGRNFDNRGKREFERKSGSDKTSVSNNLNSTNLSEDNPEWDNKTAENNVSGEVKEGEVNEQENEFFAVVEEEPKELTLDEYFAMRGKRERPQYNLRKAGEGEDLSQWKNMYEIKKKRDSEQPEEEELDTTENPQRAGRQRQVLDIDITFSDTRRGPRGARGGRAPRTGLNATPGGGRNRQRDGPRRGQRDDRGDFGSGRDRDFNSRGNRQSAPKVDDENDFPSLG